MTEQKGKQHKARCMVDALTRFVSWVVFCLHANIADVMNDKRKHAERLVAGTGEEQGRCSSEVTHEICSQ